MITSIYVIGGFGWLLGMLRVNCQPCVFFGHWWRVILDECLGIWFENLKKSEPTQIMVNKKACANTGLKRKGDLSPPSYIKQP